MGTREVCDVTVVAGEVTRLDTTLGGPFVPGDFDGDGDIVDFLMTIACLADPDQTYPANDCCLAADGDADLDVALADVALIQPVPGE